MSISRWKKNHQKGAGLGGDEGVKINRSGYDGSDNFERELLEKYSIVSFQELTPSRTEVWWVMAVCCCNMLDTCGLLLEILVIVDEIYLVG